MKKMISLVIAIVLMWSLTVTAFATTIDDFVEKAAGEIGTSYNMDPNRDYYIWEETKYGKWFSDQRSHIERFYNGSYYVHEAPWCTMFVSWCSDQVGLGIPRYSAVTEMKNWYVSEGRYHDLLSSYNPKKGDIVFFTREGEDSHVGIIESVESFAIVPFRDKKWFKLTVIEGDMVYSGEGWKKCSVERVSREVNPYQIEMWNIHNNIVVGFGEN